MECEAVAQNVLAQMRASKSEAAMRERILNLQGVEIPSRFTQDTFDRIDHICAIQYTKGYFGSKMSDMVAMYDDREISEEEVVRYIRSEEYTSRVVHMYREQAEAVFGFRWLENSVKDKKPDFSKETGDDYPN